MRAAWLAAIFAAPVSAETLSFITPPLRLLGVQHAMIGPQASQTVLFEKSGWATAFESFVVDSSGRKTPDQSAFCHTTFHYGNVYHLVHSRVTVDEGVHRISFPAGFGMKVRPDAVYILDMMLQSDDPARDSWNGIRTDIEFQPEDSGRPLRTLVHHVLNLTPQNESVRTLDGRDWGVWWVPKGRHVYQAVLPGRRGGRVHFMTAHLHRGAVEYSLTDDETGRVLFRGEVKSDAKGNLSDVPTYSSAAGFPLRTGQPLRFSVVYENPEEKPLVAMGTIHLFLEPENPDEKFLDGGFFWQP